MLETVFLYIILHDDNSNGERFRTQMPDLKTCNAQIEASKMSLPKTVGGDYEVTSVMFCGTEVFHRHYSSTWWSDAVKESAKE